MHCKRHVAFKHAKAFKNAGINPRRIQILQEVKEKDNVARLFFVANVKKKSVENNPHTLEDLKANIQNETDNTFRHYARCQ